MIGEEDTGKTGQDQDVATINKIEEEEEETGAEVEEIVASLTRGTSGTTSPIGRK